MFGNLAVNFEEVFSITIEVAEPIVIGQDDVKGRRQLIPITKGEVVGPNGTKGIVLPGGVDSQIIRSDGRCELSARYGIMMDDGCSIYIENNGIRTVPKEYVADVLAGKFIDSDLYYFYTIPSFESYSEKYRWLNNYIFIGCATRLPECVLIKIFKCTK
jgi:hypothetical protein